MKRILLIGRIGEITRSINDGLCDEFQVQLCSEQVDLISSMFRAVSPSLMIYCQIGVPETDIAFFLWAKQYRPYIPVVVISTPDKWPDIAKQCDTPQFTKLLRPVTIRTIAETCHDILDTRRGDREEETEADFDETAAGLLNFDKKERVRIMIVDDSPLFLRNIKAMLEDYYEIILANSGEKALSQMKTKKPDLILMDYEMGGMSGKDTFEAMLSDEELKEIPVIFLTSVSKKDRVFDVLEKNPSGYVLKPVDRKYLLEEIRRVTEYV